MIITSNHKEYVHSLINISNKTHIEEFLAKKIKEVLDDVGSEKFGAIVSDHASNMVLAKKLVNQSYPHIISIRCIAHHINLISSDIMKLEYSKNTIQQVLYLMKYY